jgi:hypothetical protein
VARRVDVWNTVLTARPSIVPCGTNRSTRTLRGDASTWVVVSTTVERLAGEGPAGDLGETDVVLVSGGARTGTSG